MHPFPDSTVQSCVFKKIVEPEALPLLSSKHSFLGKVFLWRREMQQASSIRLSYNAFKTRERLHGQDPQLLEWIEKAGRLMLEGRASMFKIVVRGGSVVSHHELLELLFRLDVKGAIGGMAGRHGIPSCMKYLPLPKNRLPYAPVSWFMSASVDGKVWANTVPDVKWRDWW